MKHRPTDAEANRPHALYRLYDKTGALLYIGVTADPDDRVYMHLRTRVAVEHKAIAARYHRHTLEWHPNKLAARTAERHTILTEAPLFNRQHNPTRWIRRQRRYRPVAATP